MRGERIYDHQSTGPGCEKCKILQDSINGAVKEAGVAAVVEMVEDNKEIEKYKVKSTPALVH